MVANRRNPIESSNFAFALAILGVAIFILGVFIGYHSIYRDISVAMLAPPPHAASHL